MFGGLGCTIVWRKYVIVEGELAGEDSFQILGEFGEGF